MQVLNCHVINHIFKIKVQDPCISPLKGFLFTSNLYSICVFEIYLEN